MYILTREHIIDNRVNCTERK